MRDRTLARALGFVTALMAAPAAAHEFWIEPLAFQVEEGGDLKAAAFVGQMMKGEAHPYISSTFDSFTVTDSAGVRPVSGGLGDRPALSMRSERPGLHVIAYQSTPSRTRYKTFAKFEAFLAKEGLDGIVAAHRARGLPDANFREAYTRFAKSLVAVGEGAGADAPVGFRFELIALTNPYLDVAPIKVELRFENRPQPNAQIAVFRRAADGEVTRDVLRSDAEGRATIPRIGGVTLLSAVKMVEPAADRRELNGVVWHSLWASLTYDDTINR